MVGESQHDGERGYSHWRRENTEVCEMEAIVVEQGDTYLIAWAGIHPRTRKPSKSTWQPQDNVIDAEIIEEWEEEKKKNRLETAPEQ